MRSSLVLLFLPAVLLSAKEIKIHGYITDLKSPAEFQLDDFRITRDTSLALDFEKDENDPKSPITFTPGDLKVGTEVEIKGELEDGGALRATSVKVFLTERKTVKRMALLDSTPQLDRTGDGWSGQLRVDGQKLLVQPITKVSFSPNRNEKKEIKASRKAPKSGKDQDSVSIEEDDEAGEPLSSLQSVTADTWVSYRGTRQPDGSILATSVVFKHNELEPGEARLRKRVTPKVKMLKGSSGQLTIADVGRYKLFPNDEVQAYVRDLGSKLVPSYQSGMGSDNPNKLDFQFFVAEGKQFNAFATPRGMVVVYSGVFDVLENEAQLASVLGHEIAHAVQEHAYRQMQFQRNLRTALAIGGAVAAAYGKTNIADATKLVDVAIRNGYSRYTEDQADRIGLGYMIKAGYNPIEAPRVWKVASMKMGDHATDFFWSNHNNNTTRRTYLMAELKNNYSDLDYSSLRKGDDRFGKIVGLVRDGQPNGKKLKVKY